MCISIIWTNIVYVLGSMPDRESWYAGYWIIKPVKVMAVTYREGMACCQSRKNSKTIFTTNAKLLIELVAECSINTKSWNKKTSNHYKKRMTRKISNNTFQPLLNKMDYRNFVGINYLWMVCHKSQIEVLPFYCGMRLGCICILSSE